MSDKQEEMPYRVAYEPGGIFKNKGGSFTVSALKKSYGYWGDILKAEVETHKINIRRY